MLYYIFSKLHTFFFDLAEMTETDNSTLKDQSDHAIFFMDGISIRFFRFDCSKGSDSIFHR